MTASADVVAVAVGAVPSRGDTAAAVIGAACAGACVGAGAGGGVGVPVVVAANTGCSTEDEAAGCVTRAGAVARVVAVAVSNVRSLRLRWFDGACWALALRRRRGDSAPRAAFIAPPARPVRAGVRGAEEGGAFDWEASHRCCRGPQRGECWVLVFTRAARGDRTAWEAEEGGGRRGDDRSGRLEDWVRLRSPARRCPPRCCGGFSRTGRGWDAVCAGAFPGGSDTAAALLPTGPRWGCLSVRWR